MEVIIKSSTPTLLSCAKLPTPRPQSSSSSLSPFFFIRSKEFAHHSEPFLGFRNLPLRLKCIKIKTRQQRISLLVPTSASGAETESTSTFDAERWLLEPVGDGDSRHIGSKVSMPCAFEIASDVVTIGRLPEEANMVIPIATVSGVHARIQKKDGGLLVTDLDSTNGTFVDNKRLRPGVAARISPGSCITFGDTHLAKFRVSKLENVETSVETEESEAKPESEDPSNINSESTS